MNHQIKTKRKKKKIKIINASIKVKSKNRSDTTIKREMIPFAPKQLVCHTRHIRHYIYIILRYKYIY